MYAIRNMPDVLAMFDLELGSGQAPSKEPPRGFDVRT
jgi:hypothetical protein